MEKLLELRNINKSFPGVKALDDISVTFEAGTVHSLMGENGAGKSTLMKCLFGIYSKDSGEILLQGKQVSFSSTSEAMHSGIAMVHQELNQVHTRSVMENLWLGRYPRFAKIKGTVDSAKMYKNTLDIFAEINVEIDPKAIISTLSVAERQMLEIAKAVSFNAKIIVLDEPTSSLSDTEVEKLFKIIELLKKRGCAIIYISHRMNEILAISDYITVMRDGKHIATELASKLSTTDIIKLMVGRELSAVYPAKTNVVGAPILEVDNFTCESRNVKDVSLTLKKGEILGLAGLVGAGRTELIESIFGLSTLKSGKLKLNDKDITNKNSKQAIKNGFALITEERRVSGIFGILDITANTVIASLKKFKKFGLYTDNKKMERVTRDTVAQLRVKTPSVNTKIRSLSGGNQQKVIFNRWLLTEPTVLLMDEPTRGIDVGAKYEIYQLMIELATKGNSIIMVSSELPEVMGVCDRIIVMSNGRIAGEVFPTKTTQEEILSLAAKYVE
ncbi:MAG: sugar ABC transporter ATP-binding protein [Bacillota bacterium]